MNMIYDNPEFQQYWNMAIKPLAIECCKDAELYDNIGNVRTLEDMNEALEKMKQTGRKDWDSASSINKMIAEVENLGNNGHNLVDVLYAALMSLESKNYDKRISLFDNKEVKNYKRLTKALNTALNRLHSSI